MHVYDRKGEDLEVFNVYENSLSIIEIKHKLICIYWSLNLIVKKIQYPKYILMSNTIEI